MNVVRLLFVLAVACSSPQHAPFQGGTEPGHSSLADEDEVRPTYGKADLEKQLIAERGAEATNERRVADFETKGDDDALRVAVADLAVRRRFIAALEACQAGGHLCPPRLDDPPWKFDLAADGAKPPLDAPLRFDLEDWQKVTAELHGRACACRTIACVDSVGVVIDQLETKPMQDVQADETAIASITHARECLFRLRGKTVAKPIVTPPPED
jgi:hypothetical protein